ncbi:hypothetical protein TIFTF001_046508 [Ficus carica]|uniref:Retrotransposon Copia-like N-terminal domain-containing protein n=1 Tax=Ficus carica TaxID=3494 RepID=A0AA87ZQV2_FICCA|nr:hypothetical protein TIFTF001_046508 [Ficus carica]
MDSSSTLGSASSSAFQNAVSFAQLTPNFNPLTLHLDRQNYYYWRAQVISTVRAHGFEGFLLGSFSGDNSRGDSSTPRGGRSRRGRGGPVNRGGNKTVCQICNKAGHTTYGFKHELHLQLPPSKL